MHASHLDIKAWRSSDGGGGGGGGATVVVVSGGGGLKVVVGSGDVDGGDADGESVHGTAVVVVVELPLDVEDAVVLLLMSFVTSVAAMVPSQEPKWGCTLLLLLPLPMFSRLLTADLDHDTGVATVSL